MEWKFTKKLAKTIQLFFIFIINNAHFPFLQIKLKVELLLSVHALTTFSKNPKNYRQIDIILY